MAALVCSIQVASNCLGRPLKKTTFRIEHTYIIPKILFTSKANTKKSQWISNLCLTSRAARGEPQNEWAAIAAVHEKVGEIPESQIEEYIYDSARTYFIKNS